MGKQRKRNKVDDMQFGKNYSSSKFKGERELLERYGVEGQRHGRTDRGSKGFRGYKDVKKDLQTAMSQDYDTRRTLEAASMSGDKKAKKLIKKGFKNFQAMEDTQEYFKKQHKKAGGGGQFSSVNDYMNLTQSMVKKDRNKQTEEYDSKYASQQMLNDKLEELKGKFKEEKKAEEPVEYKDSDAVAAAKSRLSGGEYDTTDSLYGASQEKEAPTTAFREANKNVPTTDDRKAATSSYLEQYKKDMITGGRIGEARSSNLNNALNTVIGSDI